MKRFKDKLRRGRDRLQGANPDIDPSSGEVKGEVAASHSISLPMRPPADGGAIDVAPDQSGAPSIPLTGAVSVTDTGDSLLPSIDKTDLWFRAADKLPVKEREWLTSASVSASETSPTDANDDQVSSITKLINKHRDICRTWTSTAVEDTISSSVAWLNKFRDVGDIISSFDPMHLALPWAGVRFILECILANQETMALAMESVERTARIVHRCRVYQVLYASEALEAALVDLYASLLLLQVKIGQFLSSSVGSLRRPDEIKSLISTVETLEEQVDREVTACQSKQVSRIEMRSQEMVSKLERLINLEEPLLRVDKNVLQVLKSIETADMVRLLEWISPIPYNLHHENVSELRTPETCEWVRKRPQFREWLSELSSITLWLQAPAGRGKTFITSKVIDTVKSSLESGENHEGFAFFYCKQTEEGRREALPILRSFVRQLSAPQYLAGHARQGEPGHRIHLELTKLYDDSQRMGSGWTVQLCKKHLVQLLNLYPRTVLVLDALDECNIQDRTLLLNFFNSLPKEVSKPIKIFIASRPEGDIRQRLIALPNIEITASSNSNDIERFIREKMEDDSPWTPVLARNAALKEIVMQTLVDKSQGMFQYAQLQIGQLVSLGSARDIRDRLEKLPLGLTATYDEIYQRILARPRHSRELTLRALRWVMSTTVPIPASALSVLVLMDADAESMDDEEDKVEQHVLQGWCANLLTVDMFPENQTGEGDENRDMKGSVWRPSHFSVVEYFTDVWPMGEVKCFVAKAHLVYLLSAEPSMLNNDDERMAARYVWLYWMRTIREQDRPGCDSDLSRMLKQFLGAPDRASPQHMMWFSRIGTLSKIHRRSRERTELNSDTPSISMALYSMYHLLQDWWEEKGPPSGGSESSRDWRLGIDRHGHCLLTLAASAGSEAICDCLIRHGCPVNPNNGTAISWGSPLAAAAWGGNTHIVAHLLSKGADANQVLRVGIYDNALVAVRYGDDEDLNLVSILLRHGADPNVPALLGLRLSALQAAIAYSKPDVVRLLVEEGRADVNAQVDRSDWGSALVAAVDLGKTDMTLLLLELGADVNMLCRFGDYGTALVAAGESEKPSLALVKLLVEHGADPDLAVGRGLFASPLAVAVADGQLETARYLVVEAGVDVNQQLSTGRYGSALQSSMDDDNRAFHGYDSDNEDDDGDDGTEPSCFEFLLDNGADVDMQLDYGDCGSALVLAALIGAQLKLETLINRGANVNMQVRGGVFGSALAAAAVTPDLGPEILKRLIGHGAQVDMVLEGGWFGTALIAAAHLHQIEHMGILVDAGANVNLYVHTGRFRTALEAAREESCLAVGDYPLTRLGDGEFEQEVVEFLLSHGAEDNVLRVS